MRYTLVVEGTYVVGGLFIYDPQGPTARSLDKNRQAAGVTLLYRRLMPVRRDSIERFWEKVDRRGPDECWPWKAGTTSSGYGCFYPTRHPAVQAHRFAYELAEGPLPPGLDVCHSCDNPLCCNPTHLFAGTAHDNIMDSARKGRWTGHPKLTEAQVRAIRAQFVTGITIKTLMQSYSVARTTIWAIVHNKSWVHLPS